MCVVCLCCTIIWLIQAKSWPLGAQGPTASPRCPRGIIFATYHKTGSTFVWKLLWHLSSGDAGDLPRVYFQASTLTFGPGTLQGSAGQHWDTDLPQQNHDAHIGQVHHVKEPSQYWQKPEGMCLIHWFRDPLSLLISGYNYHKWSIAADEHWLFKVGQCSFCGIEQWRRIFSQCGYKCTYRSLLRKQPFEKGIVTEYLRAEVTIDHMLNNLKRWEHASDVLHLSVESLRSDYNASMSCMFRFLGYQPQNLLKKVQILNVGSQLGKQRSGHVTHQRYNSSSDLPLHFTDMLWTVHGDFASSINHMIKKQSLAYGCPAQ
eukprot:gnl/TRDRNA2_/TRDRNA2_35863_c0_seq2.p1 gnl/TRDRNA2_/TRDRNA2_35863_c0~~gnl/TRDRNA2_/TRDRNA2_35863_c0_seq2.p1  ORF type:complete len:317 (+),score=14.80 gnl/TRDRNA2_/TRDRNA2_35863_c0_seq2:84-1034(+)